MFQEPDPRTRALLQRFLPSVPWTSPWLFGNPNQPQGQREPDAAYWLRSNLLAPVDPRNFGNWNNVVARPAASAIGAAMDTPAARTQFRQGQQPGIADFARGMAEQVTAQTRQPARAVARPAGSGFQPSAYAQGVGQTLSAAGLPPQVVAGILGNGHYESAGWNISGSGDRGTAHGAFQWRNERADNFRRIIGADPRQATPEQTGRFVLWELQHPQEAGMRPEHVQAILSSRTPQEAAVRFSQYYERPDAARANNERRAVLAGQYAGGTGASPAAAFTAGAMPQPPGMAPYMQGFEQGMGSLEAARTAANTPWSGSMELPAAPAIPAPPEFQAPDFTRSNELFEQGRPENPFDEQGERTRFVREHFFRGIGEALLGVQPGRPIGFGELLMRAGAGALTGRGEGEDRARAMEREYNQAMRQFNMALAQRDEQQVTIATNVLNRNVEARYNNSLLNFERADRDYVRNNGMDVQGNYLISRRQVGDRLEVHATPIAPLIDAAISTQQAQAWFGFATANQSQANFEHRLSVAQAMTAAATAAEQGGELGAQGHLFGVTLNTSAAVSSGNIWNVLPHDVLRQVYGEAYRVNQVDPARYGINPETFRAVPFNPQALASPPPEMPQHVRARIDDFVTRRLTTLAMGNDGLRQRLLTSPSMVASGAVDRIQRTRQSRRVTSGRQGVSVSETETYGE